MGKHIEMKITDREKFIALVDNDSIDKSDVIVLLEGDGYNRYSKAVELFKKGIQKRLFLVEELQIMIMEASLFKKIFTQKSSQKEFLKMQSFMRINQKTL